jgi:phosphodiesterase/alkaline phosphatase D-like protein
MLKIGLRIEQNPQMLDTQFMFHRTRQVGLQESGGVVSRLSGRDGKLSLQSPKPYWQPGWLKQHDRLMQAISENQNKIPLVISGDLHAIALGQMRRSGSLNFSENPINILLSGPVGSRPDPSGWPSGRRGTGSQPSLYLDFMEEVKPIEQHGFSIVDFTPDQIKIQMFKWDIKTQSEEDINTLEPFHTKVLSTKA